MTRRRGFSLVELMLGVALLAGVLVGALALFSTGAGDTVRATDEQLAVQVAQRAMDRLRAGGYLLLYLDAGKSGALDLATDAGPAGRELQVDGLALTGQFEIQRASSELLRLTVNVIWNRAERGATRHGGTVRLTRLLADPAIGLSVRQGPAAGRGTR